jgi:hypothetical protein
MPERSSKRQSREVDLLGAAIVEESTAEDSATAEEPVKNPAAVALGRLGGMKGGKARAAKLTPEQRIEIAKKAAAVRWRLRERNQN